MYSNNRDQMRKVFFDAWHKHKSSLPKEPIDEQLIQLISEHPEYHTILEHPEDYQETDFDETNPFLHLSLHLAIRDQVVTDRPLGIKSLFFGLCEKYQDVHEAEHEFMECLASFIWEAKGQMIDENRYLEKLKTLV